MQHVCYLLTFEYFFVFRKLLRSLSVFYVESREPNMTYVIFKYHLTYDIVVNTVWEIYRD